MDIAALSVIMSQSRVMEQASVSVMKIAMDTSKQNAESMNNMLEGATSPNLGQNLDIRV